MQPVQEARDSLFYGRCMLAPMVRVGGLGFRALCAAHGADVVFTEEVVAAKLAQCAVEAAAYPGVPAPVTELVAYEPFRRRFKRAVVFATLPGGGEGAPVVLQLGAADPAVAARAAQRCAGLVDAIDVNMGCPKKFSVANGFGAALMRDPPRAGAILRALREAAGPALPLSLKTRLCATAAATVEMLAAMLAVAGHTRAAPVVHAVTLHAREPDDRPEAPPRYERAAEVVRLCRARADVFGGVCFVLNGSLASRADGERKMAAHGFDACMLARAALCDWRVFGPPDAAADPFADLSPFKELLLYSMRYRAPFKNFKYHLTRALPESERLRGHMPAVQSRLLTFRDGHDLFALTAAEREAALSYEHEPEMMDAPPPAAAATAAAACGTKRPRPQSAERTTEQDGDSAATTRTKPSSNDWEADKRQCFEGCQRASAGC